MKSWGMVVLGCLAFFHCRAGILDSVLVFKEVRPDFGLDGFNTVIRKHGVDFGGFHVGVQLQDKYAAGIAYYSIASSVDDKMIYNGRLVNARLHFGYTALYAEYTFFENNDWEWAVGIRPGFGKIYNSYLDATGYEHDLGKQYYPLLTPYLSGTYKLLYWLGIGGGLGYRMIPVTGLSGPWIDFGVEIFFLPIYDHIIKPRVKKAFSE